MQLLKGTNSRKKVKLTIVGFMLAIVFVYYIAIKGTISVWGSCNMLELKIDSLKKAPEEIKLYKRKLQELNNSFSAQDSGKSDFHESFLNEVSIYCNNSNLIIKNYPEGHMFVDDKYMVKTNILTLEGDFSDLLQLLYYLEINSKNGHISSVSFSTLPDYRENVYKLNLIIYEQNIFDSQKNTGIAN